MTALVTVVTSSWQRPRTILANAVRSVNEQTYPEIEHIVVIDGDDPVTVDALLGAGYTYGLGRRRIAQLGRNWSSYSGDGGFGATCRLVGSWLGAGDYITYLDDDTCWLPQHVAEMVATMESMPPVDFATSSWAGGGNVPDGGAQPPGVGRTDTSAIMHHALVLKQAGGFKPDGYAGDGQLAERFIAAGMRWRHKESRTVVFPNGCNHGAVLG